MEKTLVVQNIQFLYIVQIWTNTLSNYTKIQQILMRLISPEKKCLTSYVSFGEYVFVGEGRLMNHHGSCEKEKSTGSRKLSWGNAGCSKGILILRMVYYHPHITKIRISSPTNLRKLPWSLTNVIALQNMASFWRVQIFLDIFPLFETFFPF